MFFFHLRPSGLHGSSNVLVKPDNGDEEPFFMVNDEATGTEIKNVQEEIKEKASKFHKTLDEQDLKQIIDYEGIKAYLSNHFVDKVCDAIRYQTVNEKICSNDVEILKSDSYTVVIHKLQLLQELALKNKDKINSIGKMG